MAAARKLPSSDEVGVALLEQLIKHGGKQRMRALVEPEKDEAVEEESKSDEVNIDDLAELLGSAQEE